MMNDNISTKVCQPELWGHQVHSVSTLESTENETNTFILSSIFYKMKQLLSIKKIHRLPAIQKSCNIIKINEK